MSTFQQGDEVMISGTSGNGFVIGRYGNRSCVVVMLIDEDELENDSMVHQWYKTIIPQMREFVTEWDASDPDAADAGGE